MLHVRSEDNVVIVRVETEFRGYEGKGQNIAAALRDVAELLENEGVEIGPDDIPDEA